MISNTDLLFTKAKEFQDKRLELCGEYELALQKLERFKGSEGYREERKKLTDKYESDISALIDEYRSGFRVIVGGMMDAIGRRSISAPTNEQINLLSVLKMKKKVTLEECERVAEAVKDNPIAVGVLSEIAHDHGILRSFDDLCPEMSSQKASDVLESMKNGIDDFLSYDTTRSSRLAKRYHERHYGVFTRELTKRTPFTDKESCFSELAGMDVEMLRRFSEIVDA